jgi:phosphoglycerate dehydrogenase-like enzyme
MLSRPSEIFSQGREMILFNCAVLDDYQNCALGFANWGSLKNVQVKIFTDTISTQDALVERLTGFEIIVAMRERTHFDAGLLACLPRLKLLVTTGIRNSVIDLDAAVAHGVVVCGTQILPNPAPELAWGILLALARNIPDQVASVRAGGWQTQIGVGLEGKTLGIVGLGKIGTRMARVAQAFNMSVLAWQPTITSERCKAAGVECTSSLEDLMERSDIVTVHMVLADSTRGMIGSRELARMKPTAMLVNTARGPLVDEEALVRTLQEGRIAGAALDVYDIEPLPAHHPLRTLPNVIATPHLGYVSRENYQIFFSEAVENIQNWLQGTPVRRVELLQP